MKNLMITGGAGFIGSNLIRYVLTETEFSGRIINVDKLTYAGTPESLSDIAGQFPDRYILETVDICDADRLGRVFDQYAVDAVVHLAAESHVDRSITGPGAFIQTNLVGTYTLLEAVRARLDQVQRFHHVSTDEVFGSLGENGSFSEKSAYRPSSPYSASKAGADHLVRAYHVTYGVPSTISNSSNNYGPYQYPEKLIPLMVLHAHAGKLLPVYGDGMQKRDWLHVRDHAIAIWTVLCNGVLGETYNVCGRCEMPNLRVVEAISDILDELQPLSSDIRHPTSGQKLSSRRDLITFVKDRPGHDRRYAMDCSKIRRELGWAPEEPFAAGLRKCIQWYLDHSEWVEHALGERLSKGW